MSHRPRISVIIPTYKRADLLAGALESLEKQSLSHDEYEVIVVDDGSPDRTGELCEARKTRLPLRYFRQENSTSAVAKNTGIFVSNAPIVFFFDDDDVASETLLEEHLKAHEKYPADNVAILNLTTWHPDLEITPVMDYLVNIGQFLFSYVSLEKDQRLDFSYFWTGRISCKRQFLTHFGVFTRKMRRVEDIELGYRLAQHGLEIRYWPDAVSHMVRPITYEQFCARQEGDGRSLAGFSRLYEAPIVQEYSQVVDIEQRWRAAEPQLETLTRAVAELESLIGNSPGEEDRPLLGALWELYRRSFIAFKLKGVAAGVVEATTAGTAERC